MSASETVFRGTSQHPDCRPTARVIVGDVEVPTVNGQDGSPPSIEVQMRKTGVSDLTKSADVHIPYVWFSDDVLTAVTDSVETGYLGERGVVGDFEGFRKIGNGPIRIDVLDPTVDEYVAVFNGAINNIGPSPIDGAFRLLCVDWANYFQNISYNSDIFNMSFTSVVEDIVSRINAHNGIPDFEFVSANVSADDTILESPTVNKPATAPISPLAIITAADILLPDIGLNSEKSFHKYKHSVVDALDWATTLVDAQWYVEYDTDSETNVIVIDTDFEGPQLDGAGLFTDSYSVGDVGVVTNNALFQLGPQYTLGGRGKKTQQLEEVEGTVGPGGRTGGTMTTTTVIPEVVVRHDRLWSIAGENPNPRFIETNASDLDTLEQQVTKELKSRMDDAAGGEIVALPAPLARPYGTITAKPACNGRLQQSVPDITYEIEEVIHTITNPTVDTDTGPRTLLRCGIEATKADFDVQSKRLIELD